MANAGCKPKNKMKRNCIPDSAPSGTSGSVSKSHNTGPQQAVNKPHLPESWTAVLKEIGMPDQLIKLVEKAQFEDWVQQNNHIKGSGLYYSDDFNDLPPRFRKKFLELMYKWQNHMCTEDEVVATLKGESLGYESQVVQHDCVTSNSSSPLTPGEQQHVEKVSSEKPVGHTSTRSSPSGCSSNSVKRDSDGSKVRIQEAHKHTNSDCISRFENAGASRKDELQDRKMQNDKNNRQERYTNFNRKNSEQFNSKGASSPSSISVGSENSFYSKKEVYVNKNCKKTVSHDFPPRDSPHRRSFKDGQTQLNMNRNKRTSSQSSVSQDDVSSVIHRQNSLRNKHDKCANKSMKMTLSQSSLNQPVPQVFSDDQNRKDLNGNRTLSGGSSMKNFACQSPISNKKESKFQDSEMQSLNILLQESSVEAEKFHKTPNFKMHQRHSSGNSFRRSANTFQKPVVHSVNAISTVSDKKNSSTLLSDHTVLVLEDKAPVTSNQNELNKKHVPKKQFMNNKHANSASTDESAKDNVTLIRHAHNKTGLSNMKAYDKHILVTVLEKADDIKYWTSYIQSIIECDNFTLKVHQAKSQVLKLIFPDSKIAVNAYLALKNFATKPPEQSCIKNISLNMSPEHISKIIAKDIALGLEKRLSHHDDKINSVEKELSSEQSKSNNKMVVEAVKAKLQSLKDMRHVFCNYMDNVQKKLHEQCSVPVKVINQLKHDIIRECNCLDGCLPIYSKKEEILSTVRNNSVSIIVADTGSGKSTQLAQYLFRDVYPQNGIVVCTQPRKMAAISICNYISGQLGSPSGEIVGYETGVRKKISKHTKIVFMTDYTLLRKCVFKKEFENISCVIVDEAHERSLYSDLLLGMLKQILKERKDLKVIITSATIDPSVFLNYFKVEADALVEVPGRMYPVSVKWYDEDAYIGWNYVEACAKCAHDIHCHEEQGGILVFLTSPAETEEAVSIFKFYDSKRSEKSAFSPLLLCLHGKQDIDDQLKIFTPASKGHRKIVFATNSAETSLTIPDIKYVVDSGMTKELRYDEVKKRSALVVGFVSRSSAAQRKGRAGRTQPGVCYRMYTEKNFKHDMNEDSPPEILRSPLQKALLKILDLRIRPEKFDFLSAPPSSCITDAMNSLKTLGAVEGGKLTEIGKQMAKLPLEPQLAKLVLKGIEKDIGYEVVIIVVLTKLAGHIFNRTDDNKAKSDEKKIPFCHPNGDFHTYLLIFHEWTLTKENKAIWCEDNFISMRAMKLATARVNELCQILWDELQISVSKKFKKPAFFHETFESILFECFSENLCVFSGHKRAGYISPFHGESFFVHPSSALSYLGENPQFVVFDIVLYTSRNFLLNVATVTESAITQAYQEGKFSIPVYLLKNLQVLPIVYRPVGETVLIRHILGKDGMNIKNIEKKIRCLTKSSTFHVSVSVEKGEIIVFAEQQHHKLVSGTIEKFIEDGRAALATEEEILCAPGSVHYKFALGCGGNVHDVILPGESREVIIQSSYLNVPVVLKMLGKYGTLVSHYEINSEFPSLSVLYQKVSSADRAVLAFQNNKTYTVTRGKANIFQKEISEQLFRILVKWCRLPCKGSGFIEFFNPADCIEASYKLTVNSIYVGDNYVVVEPLAKSGDRFLKMTNLPDDAQEFEVKCALRKNLPSHIIMKSVKLVRDDQIRTYDSQISMQKRRLQDVFAPYSSPSNFQVEIQHPDPCDSTWTAMVYFSNLKDGEKAFLGLKDNLKLGKFKADVSLALKSTVHCKPDIYKVLKEEIEKCRKKYEASRSSIKILQKPNCVSIQMSCNTVTDLGKMRREIIALIQGRVIICHENPTLVKLFAQRSHISFDEIERSTKTLIILNKVAKSISIYGSKKSCEEAEHLITHKSVGSGIIKTKIFDLHGTYMPKGFIKILYQKYGFHLRGLVKHYSLKSAYIDLEKHQLVLEGSVKHISEAESHLEEMCCEISENTDAESEQKVEPNEEFCPVCLDKISSMDAIRLENCGHPVCKLCLQLQLKSEVLPILCVKKECEKPFVVEDFRRIFATQQDLKEMFSDVVLQYFIKQNLSEVRYCPTPDCPMIYRVGTREFQKVCPSCENSICTRCHSLFHHGMTCTMFQETRKDEDYPLKVWLRKDALNRKVCPGCSTAIEKDGGCNHVTCGNCGSHICWSCVKVFKSSEDVYDHMHSCFAST